MLQVDHINRPDEVIVLLPLMGFGFGGGALDCSAEQS